MRQKSELISQVKLREACLLLPGSWLLVTGYCLLNVIKLGHKRSACRGGSRTAPYLCDDRGLD